MMDVLTLIGSSTMVVGALAWLAKAIITHVLGKKAEKDKLQAATATDLAKERLRNDLSKVATEHQVTFSRLHGERVEIIKQTHGFVVDVISASNRLAKVVGDTGRAEEVEVKHGETRTALISLNEFHAKSGIFLPTNVAKQVDDFVTKLHGELVRMTLANYAISTLGMERRSMSFDADTLGEMAARLRSDLEKEFRFLLGADQNTGPG